MSPRPTLAEIREAAKRLAAYFPPTPLVHAPSLSASNAPVFLKLELRLPTGSFKPRGALCALLANLQRGPIEEVTASSTGNHGAAVAFAAKALGLRATIFLPANPNLVKRKKIAALGACVVESGGPDLADAFVQARDYSSRAGVFFLNDATDPDLPAGPATIGLEILEQLPEARSILVPVGDTALIRGVAAAVHQLGSAARIIGVQAERAPSYYLSWKAGRAVPTERCDTCADGLATRTPDPENVRAIRELVDDIVLVSEEEMIDAIRRLYEGEGIVAEPAGAAGAAAFHKHRDLPGPAVLVVSGGNISDAVRERAGLPRE